MFQELLERNEQRMLLMRRMMDRLNVDAVEAARHCWGSAYLSAIRACRACPNTDLCRQWLKEPHASRDKPAFCANADFFLAHKTARDV